MSPINLITLDPKSQPFGVSQLETECRAGADRVPRSTKLWAMTSLTVPGHFDVNISRPVYRRDDTPMPANVTLPHLGTFRRIGSTVNALQRVLLAPSRAEDSEGRV